MQLTYVGPHDAVEIVLADGSLVTVKHGESADVPDEIAEGLLEQDTFEAAKASKSTKKTDSDSAGISAGPSKESG